MGKIKDKLIFVKEWISSRSFHRHRYRLCTAACHFSSEAAWKAALARPLPRYTRPIPIPVVRDKTLEERVEHMDHREHKMKKILKKISEKIDDSSRTSDDYSLDEIGSTCDDIEIICGTIQRRCDAMSSKVETTDERIIALRDQVNEIHNQLYDIQQAILYAPGTGTMYKQAKEEFETTAKNM